MLSKSPSLELKLQASHLVDALQRNVTANLSAASVEIIGNSVTVRLYYRSPLPKRDDEHLNDIKVEFEALQTNMRAEPFVLRSDQEERSDSEYLVYQKRT